MVSSTQITPVILCGGSGTRLWPLSRKSYPKQFVPLIENKSLYQLTLERSSCFSKNIMTIASEDHRFMILDAMEQANVSGPLILEPVARNTAPAMTLAALHSLKENPEELLLFCPADHYIPNNEQFQATIQKGIKAAQNGTIVTYGVVPTFPSSAYGYIKQGIEKPDNSFNVESFIEKPDQEKAQQFLLAGNYLWNAGIFLTTPATLIKALNEHSPQILDACKNAMAKGTLEQFTDQIEFFRPEKHTFSQSPSNSIDYAVLEHHQQIAVIPFDGQWSDIGSWNVIANLTEPDENQNRIEGQGIVHESKATYINAPYRPVIALGTKDLLIIDTPDAVLIADSNHAEKVKDIVAQLDATGYSQAISHRKVSRPWGWYDSVDVGDRFQVKRIGVKPGAALSLQKHHHRAEHWIIVKGTAEVTRGEEVFLLTENQSTYIPIGEIHRLRNPGKIELEMIEVQSGRYLGEDDIVRLEDTYGRIKDSE